MCGTPHYMAPELALRKDYDGKAADMWALGVILFVLITGKLPFFGDFEDDLYRRISKGRFHMPNESSSHLKKVLSGLLQVQPSKRLTA